MVVVRITMNVLPEKHMEVMQTLVSMIEPSAKEAGCMSYDVFCDIEDKNRFSLLEEWDTRKNLDQHTASKRFGVLLGIKTLLSEPLEIQIHTVSKTEGMEAVQVVRASSNPLLQDKSQGGIINEAGNSWEN
jgi:quinol monooxygenase YgiN